MFNSRHLFRDIPCPQGHTCNRPICLFSHSPTAVLKVTQVDPLPVPAPVPVSTIAPIVPAKRRAQPDEQADPQQATSSTRRSYPINVERPTKLQKTGSAARPAAVPTASSSTVSSLVQPPQRYL